MNTTMIELACLGLFFAGEKATGNRQQGTGRAGKAVTDKAWKQLLREEALLRA